MAKKKDKKIGHAESPNPGDQKEEVKGWQQAISTTEQWRRGLPKFKKTDDYVKEYGGDWSHISQTVDIPLMPINLVYAYVKTEVARLYFRDPWITVNPKRMEDYGAARIAEQLINYTWGELDLKKQIKLALLDALLAGHGWIKVGYTAEFGTVESKDPNNQKKQNEVVTNEFVKSEEVFAYHVPYKDVLFSPDSLRPPYDSRWVAFKIEKPLRAIQESGIYENTEDLKPLDKPSDSEPRKLDQGKVQKVVLWEIWDMDHRRVVTISPTSEKFLRDIPWPYEMKGYPLVMFGFNPMPGEPYPISDIAPWEAHVVELMKMMAIMTNHLKRWNRQLFVKEGFVTEEEMKKFRLGIDGAIIRYQGKPGEDFFIPPYAAVQQDIYGVWNLIMEMWRNVSGQSEIDRGAPGRTETGTLGELRMQMAGGRARSDEKVDVLEDQISEVARKLLSLMKQYMTMPKIVRIVGNRVMDEAMQKSIQTRPSLQNNGALTQPDMFSTSNVDLPEDPDVDTVAGSTIPLNKENKLKIMTDMLPTLQFMGIQPGGKAALELGKEILREVDIKALERVGDIAEKEIDDLKAQQQQMMQMQQQGAQQEQQAGMRESQGKAQSEALRLESAKTAAQAQSMQAKASTLQAEMKLKESLLKHVQLMSGAGNGDGKKE